MHRIEQTTFDRLVALLEANLTPGERRRLVIDGGALTPDAAVALAAGSEDPER